MSTKIPHGHLIDPDMSPLELAAAARDALRAERHARYVHLLARDATLLLDLHRSGHQPPLPLRDSAPVDAVTSRIADAGRSAFRDPRYDLDAELVLLASPAHTRSGHTLALLFAEHPGYHDTFGQLPGVSSYAYWNHTDRPTDVTVEEWQARRDAWDQALAGRPPAHVGLSWKLPTGPGQLTPAAVRADLEQALPNRLQRAHALAAHLVPVVTIGGDGAIAWREPEVVAAEREGQVAGLLETLQPVTVEDLYCSPAEPAA